MRAIKIGDSEFRCDAPFDTVDPRFLGDRAKEYVHAFRRYSINGEMVTAEEFARRLALAATQQQRGAV